MARRAVKRGIPVHVELQFTQGWRRFPGSMTNISETPPTATPGTPVVFLEGDTEPSVGETSAYQLTIDAQVVQTSAHLKQLQSRVGTTNTITGRIILPEGTPAIASGDDGGTVAVDGSTVDFAFAGTQAYPGACLKIAGEYLEVDQVNADGSIKSLINNPTAAREQRRLGGRPGRRQDGRRRVRRQLRSVRRHDRPGAESGRDRPGGAVRQPGAAVHPGP